MASKKDDTNELTKKRKNNSRVRDGNKSMVGQGFFLVIREEINWETGIDRAKLLYIK